MTGLLIGTCDGVRKTTLRTETIIATKCETLDFQLVRNERGSGGYESEFYTGKIRKTEDGYSIDFESPEYFDDEYQVSGRPLVFPLMADATGHGVKWSWIKLYCAGSTEPVFDSGKVDVEQNTCFYEAEGYWVTLLDRSIAPDSGFCCEPLIPCKAQD